MHSATLNSDVIVMYTSIVVYTNAIHSLTVCHYKYMISIPVPGFTDVIFTGTIATELPVTGIPVDTTPMELTAESTRVTATPVELTATATAATPTPAVG